MLSDLPRIMHSSCSHAGGESDLSWKLLPYAARPGLFHGGWFLVGYLTTGQGLVRLLLARLAGQNCCSGRVPGESDPVVP